MSPVFHRLHITENSVGVPQMFYLKINVWKVYPNAVVPDLFVTAGRSVHDNILPRPGSTLWRLLFSNSRNEVTTMNHQIRLLQYSLQLCSISNTLTSCFMLHALTLRTQQCFHRKNRKITCPDTYPFERGAMGSDVPFYNSIIGNFIVYQDQIETDSLKLCAHPENSKWFSVISVIISEVSSVAEQKQEKLA